MSTWKCNNCNLKNVTSADKCMACFSFNPLKYWICEPCDLANSIDKNLKCIACFNPKPLDLNQYFTISEKHQIFLTQFIQILAHFGCDIGVGLPASDIYELEQELNITFPSEFVSFLLMIGSFDTRNSKYFSYPRVFNPLSDIARFKKEIRKNIYSLRKNHKFSTLICEYYPHINLKGMRYAPKMIRLDNYSFLPCLRDDRAWCIDRNEIRNSIMKCIPFDDGIIVNTIMSYFQFKEPLRPVFVINEQGTIIGGVSFFDYLIQFLDPNINEQWLLKELLNTQQKWNKKRFTGKALQKALPFWSQLLYKPPPPAFLNI